MSNLNIIKINNKIIYTQYDFFACSTNYLKVASIIRE